MTMDSPRIRRHHFHETQSRERKDVMQRRLGSLTLITVGVALIAGTFAFQMFSRAPAFEKMTTDFSRNVTPATVAALRTNVADLSAAGTELRTTGIPALAGLLKVSPAQFQT